MTDDRSAQRDAQVRLARRLGVGLASAGVVGSFGAAGAVAAAPGPSSDTSPPSRQAGDDDESFSQGDDRVAQPGQQSDQGAQTRQQGSPPALQQGFGPSHGSTGGS